MTDRSIRCSHPDYESLELEVSFSEFWTGIDSPRKGKWKLAWAGNFSGRPTLAEELFPTVQVLLANKKPQGLQKMVSCLRCLFRFLDGYEAWCASNIATQAVPNIRSLSDLTPHHFASWMNPSPDGFWVAAEATQYRQATNLIALARAASELSPAWFPSYPATDRTKLVNIPNEEVGRLLVAELSQMVSDLWNEWERCDRLAQVGENLLESHNTVRISRGVKNYESVTEADLHATYRALALSMAGIPPSRNEFYKVLGYQDKTRRVPSWWPRYNLDHPDAGTKVSFFDLPRGMYPNSTDSALLLLLFIARTGWNQAVALSLDITSNASWNAQYSPHLIWMFSFKQRANMWQDTLSWVKKRTGPYQIVMRTMERTRPIRAAFTADSDLCELPLIAARSPWIHLRVRRGDSQPFGVLTDPASRHLVAVLQRVLKRLKGKVADTIVESIKPTDFRHIYAGAIFKKTGYSLVLTQWALGHKRSKTTFEYLRSRAFREESERSKNGLVVAVFDQIEVHKKIDLTLLRAKMDGIEVSKAQIDSLEMARKNRTYSGAGCSSPLSPPVHIDPNHPRDGLEICSQGHRCFVCPMARVFGDSINYLARRCVELEWQRDHSAAVSFDLSSASDDLLVLHATLKQWPPEEVLSHMKEWREKVTSGLHVPILFAGEH